MTEKIKTATEAKEFIEKNKCCPFCGGTNISVVEKRTLLRQINCHTGEVEADGIDCFKEDLNIFPIVEYIYHCECGFKCIYDVIKEMEKRNRLTNKFIRS